MGKLPTLFISHGSPMNAIEDNNHSKMLKELASAFERPKAIMVISAHWNTKGTEVTYADRPNQIYDFYGFPEELYNLKYTPDGGKEYVDIVLELLKSEDIKTTNQWGIDHGAWCILTHMYPKADIPVFQLSINALGAESYHLNLGKRLSKLREKDILIIGSGNIVHNLREIDFDEDAKPFPWAVEFDKYIADAIINRDYKKLLEFKSVGEAVKLSLPTTEHYLPLLYIMGTLEEEDKVKFIYEGIELGSLSMRSVMVY
ncbi:MAG: 4,5-DOPA dioxygenase extradiol [Clostridiaceae bacterium]